MQRTAVDPKAKSYYEQYFGDYGKAWVKDIPRRVTAALSAELAADAARRARVAQVASVGPVHVRPVNAASYVRLPNGGIVLEGLARAPQARVARAFVAEFSPEGVLVRHRSRSVPAGV